MQAVLAGLALLAVAQGTTVGSGKAPAHPPGGFVAVPTGGVPCAPAPLVSPGAIAPYSAVPSAAWTDLFDQSSGWTGADGVYSVPLSGDERPCAGHRTTTFFTFSDTFIGEVNEQGQRLPGSVIVNNTQALLAGGTPVPSAIAFHWTVGPGGAPGPMVVPDTEPDDFFWPLDGIVVEGRLLLFALRMEHDTSAFGVAIAGISQLAWTVAPGPPFASYSQVSTPLKRAEDTYGRAIFANTVEAHAPSPDGYVYVYGLREQPLDKRLLAARVPPSALEDFGAYRFWNGSSWTSDMTAAVPLVDRLSSEFSIGPLADGRVLLCYQQDDFLGPDVTVRIGDGPLGPFGPVAPIYFIPEPSEDPDWFAYGAKAHPHLSQPDRLLVSYHVNTFDFAEHFENADIYRPRFVELPLQP